MNVNKLTLSSARHNSKMNYIAIILLAVLLVSLFTPLTTIPSYAEESGNVEETLIPEDVDDPIKFRLTQGIWILEIQDYNPKYLDTIVDSDSGLTLRDFLLDKEGGLVGMASVFKIISISGELDSTIFDVLNQLIEGNIEDIGNEKHIDLTSVTISTTKNIPQSEIDYWKNLDKSEVLDQI
jgi:hypothetical protein